MASTSMVSIKPFYKVLIIIYYTLMAKYVYTGTKHHMYTHVSTIRLTLLLRNKPHLMVFDCVSHEFDSVHAVTVKSRRWWNCDICTCTHHTQCPANWILHDYHTHMNTHVKIKMHLRLNVTAWQKSNAFSWTNHSIYFVITQNGILLVDNKSVITPY